MNFYTESSPHIKDGDTTQKIMLRVIIALLPAIIYSVVIFGNRVIILYLTSIITCVLSTIIVKKVRRKPKPPKTSFAKTIAITPPITTIVIVAVDGKVITKSNAVIIEA